MRAEAEVAKRTALEALRHEEAGITEAEMSRAEDELAGERTRAENELKRYLEVNVKYALLC